MSASGSKLRGSQRLRRERWDHGNRDTIDALGNDVAVFHDDGAERAAMARQNIVEREFNCAGHERVVHVLSLDAFVCCVNPATANPRKWVDIDSAAVSLRREYKRDYRKL